ncbi:MAG: glucosamine-6-phosphate deaminase [Verrucomicrobia bacterium]|nr:glucosamine-6-phosphate deaminase [Verrucomicrobiota bacterium]
MASPPIFTPRSFRVGQLRVEVRRSRAEAGLAAATDAAEHLRGVLARQEEARVIFACAPSQDEFLDALTGETGIDWHRVTGFHMDEYVGLARSHPASFRNYLREHVTSRIPLGRVHELAGDAADVSAEASRYSALLAEAPIDLVCLGIGENGHIAFNDPPVADFADPLVVKKVELDLACREQQVNDGCFPRLGEVPAHALTLSIPALMSGQRLCCVVPGARKAAAVRSTLLGPISTACPASVLRTHPAATLYIDPDSASGFSKEALS